MYFQYSNTVSFALFKVLALKFQISIFSSFFMVADGNLRKITYFNASSTIGWTVFSRNIYGLGGPEGGKIEQIHENDR